MNKKLLLYENEKVTVFIQNFTSLVFWGHRESSKEIIFMPSFIACFDPGS